MKGDLINVDNLCLWIRDVILLDRFDVILIKILAGFGRN